MIGIILSIISTGINFALLIFAYLQYKRKPVLIIDYIYISYKEADLPKEAKSTEIFNCMIELRIS